MAITVNKVIYWARKLFRFWKKYEAQNKPHNQQQQHQQAHYGGGQQQQYGSPYPSVPQHSQGAWNTGGKVPPGVMGGAQHVSGPYGAHDGPATNQDMVNAQNSYYVNLRNQAIHEGDLMGQCFQKSKAAYNAGDGAQAKNLSEEGHMHQQRKDQLNHEAASWIFNENNKVQPEGSIDLHGLYVQESIEFTERAVENARARGLPQLRVIVGKGNHSANHVAKIKPAIEDMMRRQKLSAHLDPHNAGVLVVLLQGQQGGSRGIADDLEKNPDVCTIM